jgi:hypothetical protein
MPSIYHYFRKSGFKDNIVTTVSYSDFSEKYADYTHIVVTEYLQDTKIGPKLLKFLEELHQNDILVVSHMNQISADTQTTSSVCLAIT